MAKRGAVHLTHCVHCQERVKAEETVEHRVCNSYNIAQSDSALINGFNAWVGVRLMTEAMKEVVEYRVNIAVTTHTRVYPKVPGQCS